MIFPTLGGQDMGMVNLNRFAKNWLKCNPQGSINSNPFLNPRICQKIFEHYHSLLRIHYSYGGYMENRSVLWRGSYLAEKKTYLHLGVDFNVPVGTPVAVGLGGQVVLVDNDTPLVGGWGTRVMLKLRHADTVLIYAHLARDVSCRVGDTLKRGDIFARVGSPNFNGYWYPHLHVQAMTLKRYQEFKNNPKGLDGYGLTRDISRLRREFPNPMQYVSV